jgi:hypothetical protein
VITAVDSSIIIDVLEPDAEHGPASREALREIGIAYSPMTEEAALRAAECWYRFRKRSGGKERIVADFLIGGHALVQGDRLLTRDRGFYRAYFKPLKLVVP